MNYLWRRELRLWREGLLTASLLSLPWLAVACGSDEPATPPAQSGGSGGKSGAGGSAEGGGAGDEHGGAGAEAGARQEGGAGGADGGGGAGGNSNEYLDANGQCHARWTSGAFGCKPTYAEAIATPPRCGSLCAGPADDKLVTLEDCTPALRCAYDGTTRELVGAFYADDVASHCDGASFSVLSGDFPMTIALNGFDVDVACSPPAESSVSPLLNELFSSNDPVAPDKDCRSGHDDCRGSVRLFVCKNDKGRVAGDGTCQRCQTDAECSAEYAYSGSAQCDSTGLCRFGEEWIGACNSSSDACMTAAGIYACADGVCARCTTNEQCARSGRANLCMDGECFESFPSP